MCGRCSCSLRYGPPQLHSHRYNGDGASIGISGDYPISPRAVTEALAVNPPGQATAWMHAYRPDRPWPGYV
jgi:hypothetical protein